MWGTAQAICGAASVSAHDSPPNKFNLREHKCSGPTANFQDNLALPLASLAADATQDVPLVN